MADSESPVAEAESVSGSDITSLDLDMGLGPPSALLIVDGTPLVAGGAVGGIAGVCSGCGRSPR